MKWGDEGRPPMTTQQQVRAMIYAAVIILACVVALLVTRADTVIDRGAAAFYSSSYDGAGWDRIIARHIDWGQVDPAVAYSEDGYYCVRVGVPLGTTLTLTNAESGVSLTCTVADSVAVADQPYWWRHFVIEVSWQAWEALGLADGNDVIVSA